MQRSAYGCSNSAGNGKDPNSMKQGNLSQTKPDVIRHCYWHGGFLIVGSLITHQFHVLCLLFSEWICFVPQLELQSQQYRGRDKSCKQVTRIG